MKNLKTYLLLAANVITIVVLFFYYLGHKDLKSQYETTSSILAEKEAKIRVVELANGRLKQEKQSAIVEDGNAKEALKSYKNELKDLEENHGVEVKQLHSYYKAKLRTTGSGIAQVGDTTIITKDSVINHYPTIKLNDGYLSLNGYFTQSKFNYKYSITDSLSIVHYWDMKGIWPFKRKDKLIVSFSSTNPNTELTSATSIVIQDTKKDRFSVGPYIGYGVGKGGASIQVGVGVQWVLFRF